MRRMWAISAAVLLASAGCAHRPGPAQASAPTATRPADPLHDLPLTLRGDDTKLRVSFSGSDDQTSDEEFEPDEICHLRAGPWRIDCTTSGSWLTFIGDENDASPLLQDNPMWQVRAAHPNSSGGTLMRFFGVLFLLGGSVDRMPSVLADYIDREGPHQEAALALAQRLLMDKPLVLIGTSQGGGFTVTMELTDSGRQLLEDSLNGESGSSNGIQMVSHRARQRRNR